MPKIALRSEEERQKEAFLDAWNMPAIQSLLSQNFDTARTIWE